MTVKMPLVLQECLEGLSGWRFFVCGMTLNFLTNRMQSFKAYKVVEIFARARFILSALV